MASTGDCYDGDEYDSIEITEERSQEVAILLDGF